MNTRIAALIALSIASIQYASATSFTPLALPTLDTDIRTISDGATYNPLFPASSQTLGGVPFEFQEIAGNTAYIGDPALVIPAGIDGATIVYTLINTAWGVQDSLAGTITFNGSGGLTHSVELRVGVNVRDHFFGGFVNTTSDPSTTQNVFGDPNPGRAHLDMQAFNLPPAFAGGTLTDIIFQPLGGNPGGRAFLVAATVASASVPDAGPTLLLSAVAGALLVLIRVRADRQQ